MKFNIVLRQAEEGGFNVTVPALDGCFTQGETEREAIICHLEGLQKLNQIKSTPKVTLKEIEVAI